MPARRSQFSAAAQIHGADVMTLYEETARLLEDPATISFPTQYSINTSWTGYLLQHWLYQAFDDYVLRDKDLPTVLKDAEVIARGFQGCAENLPPLDVSDRDNQRVYIKQLGDCVGRVDPALKILFDLIPQ
jgi:hypothetical protein